MYFFGFKVLLCCLLLNRNVGGMFCVCILVLFMKCVIEFSVWLSFMFVCSCFFWLGWMVVWMIFEGV